MKVCNLCTRQFPTVRGRNIHVARCHKQPLSKMRATPRGGIVLRPAVPPSHQQLKQPRNQSTATVAYVSGRSQSMRAVNFADNGGNGTGNVAGDSSIGHGRGAGSGNRQKQMDKISSNGREQRRGGHVVHVNPRFLNGQQAAIAGSVNRQQIDNTSSNGREQGRNGNNDGGGSTKQRDNLALSIGEKGNFAGGSNIGHGGGNAGGSGNRQQMDATSSNERKRRNDNGTNDNGDSIAGTGIDKAIEEHAGQEAADEADDDGTLEGQIKRAKLRYYNTNIVESQLRADLLRLKIARMKRKE